MISVSTKMPYQEVKEISLRSGKAREDEGRKKAPTLPKGLMDKTVLTNLRHRPKDVKPNKFCIV